MAAVVEFSSHFVEAAVQTVKYNGPTLILISVNSPGSVSARLEPFYQNSDTPERLCRLLYERCHCNHGNCESGRARLVRSGLEGEPGGLVGWRMKFYQVWLVIRCAQWQLTNHSAGTHMTDSETVNHRRELTQALAEP